MACNHHASNAQGPTAISAYVGTEKGTEMRAKSVTLRGRRNVQSIISDGIGKTRIGVTPIGKHM
jgi:hypothetical protein